MLCTRWKWLIQCVRVINSSSKIIFKIPTNSAPTEHGAVPPCLSVDCYKIYLFYDYIFRDEGSVCFSGFAHNSVVAFNGVCRVNNSAQCRKDNFNGLVFNL